MRGRNQATHRAVAAFQNCSPAFQVEHKPRAVEPVVTLGELHAAGQGHFAAIDIIDPLVPGGGFARGGQADIAHSLDARDFPRVVLIRLADKDLQHVGFQRQVTLHGPDVAAKGGDLVVFRPFKALLRRDLDRLIGIVGGRGNRALGVRAQRQERQDDRNGQRLPPMSANLCRHCHPSDKPEPVARPSWCCHLAHFACPRGARCLFILAKNLFRHPGHCPWSAAAVSTTVRTGPVKINVWSERLTLKPVASIFPMIPVTDTSFSLLASPVSRST